MDKDLELVQRARDGSQEAFALLVERYQSRVFNLARALAGSSDADDLAQEVFLKVYRGLTAFRGDSTFRTWLYRIAVNVIRSHRATGSFWERFGFSRVRTQEGDEVDVIENLAAPGNLELDAARRDVIDKALGQLTPNLREAVTLRDIEGLDYREMATVLHVPIGTVMSRISRGRQRLRPLLAPLMGAAAQAKGGEGGTA